MAQGVGPKVKECLDHMLRLFSLTERERERERDRERETERETEREIGLGYLLLFSFLLYI